jgi:hypothetical protein
MKKITNKALIIAATIVLVSVIVATLILLHKMNKQNTSDIVYEQEKDTACIEKTEVNFLNGLYYKKEEKHSACEEDTIEIDVPK